MLRAIADEAAKEDVIENEERTLIHSIIDFGDTVVRDVMVPRPDMVAVESHARIIDVIDIIIPAGFSRIPVYGAGDRRHRGDRLRQGPHAGRARRAASEEPVSTIMREAQFTPESKRVSELMREMQAGKFHMAIVVDEFGGTAGLVTLEDLIEELVGEITDEYDVEEVPPERLADGTVVVNARMPVDEVNEMLEDVRAARGGRVGHRRRLALQLAGARTGRGGDGRSRRSPPGGRAGAGSAYRPGSDLAAVRRRRRVRRETQSRSASHGRRRGA